MPSQGLCAAAAQLMQTFSISGGCDRWLSRRSNPKTILPYHSGLDHQTCFAAHTSLTSAANARTNRLNAENDLSSRDFERRPFAWLQPSRVLAINENSYITGAALEASVPGDNQGSCICSIRLIQEGPVARDSYGLIVSDRLGCTRR